jgi:hypothetical protein
MPKVPCEFWCNECYGYTYYRLNVALNGNHIVKCANSGCEHKHYRVVKDGEITSERFDKYGIIADEIIPMPSAFSQEKRVQQGSIAEIRQREAIGEHQ